MASDSFPVVALNLNRLKNKFKFEVVDVLF